MVSKVKNGLRKMNKNGRWALISHRSLHIINRLINFTHNLKGYIAIKKVKQVAKDDTSMQKQTVTLSKN